MSNEALDVYIDEEPELNQTITGFLGSFNTNESYNVNFMLSGLNVREFKLLEIASEAFKFDQVDFEEMVQRDVDTVRVQEELIDQYLKKGRNRALFFPPLIVSVIAFDKDDKPKHQFREIHEVRDGRKIIKRWDTFFAIEAVAAEKDTGSYIKLKDEDIPIHPYASKIRYDDKKVKLIVIDGQHRFFALRTLSKTNPDLVKEIYLPICVVFSPDAMEKKGDQDVMVNLRNMFVTINNKAKEVSGHFLDLLNDHSIASFCIRELANSWKDTSDNSLTSKLQFIEWNQRAKSKSNQVNKKHSITTVSIIAEVLRKDVFGKKNESKTYNLLKLGAKKEELEKHPHSTSIDYITDSEFDIEQSYILRDLARDNIVPCLNYLLLEPSVYKQIQSNYLNALKLIDEKVSRGVEGWETFKSFLKDFKETNKLSPEPAIIAEKEFNRTIILDSEIENYRRNVFQQAYIRVWAQVGDYLAAEYELSPLIVAKSLVASFEKLVFDYRRNLFDREQPYASLVLYDRSGKPNVSVRGKQFWTELLMSFFAEDKTLEEFLKQLNRQSSDPIPLSDIDQIRSRLKQWGIDSASNYCKEFLDKLEQDFIANWRLKEFPKPFKDRLERLLSEESAENLEEFSSLLKEKANYSFSSSIEPLLDILGIDKSLLIKSKVTQAFDEQI